MQNVSCIWVGRCRYGIQTLSATSYDTCGTRWTWCLATSAQFSTALTGSPLLQPNSTRGRVKSGAKAVKSSVLAPPLEPRGSLNASTFDLWFEGASPGPSGHSSGHRIGAATVLRAWQDGASLVPLGEGGWAPLPLSWLQRFGQRVADLLAARAANGSVPRYALPELARLCDALEQPRPPEFTGLQALLEDFHGLPEVPLPAGIEAILRPYQRHGVNWLAFLRQAGLGALLADDMGLGKTLQTLCVLQGRTLVVAPTSVLHHWADELQRFRPDLRMSMYHGPQRTLTTTADVTLTTYAIMRMDAAEARQAALGGHVDPRRRRRPSKIPTVRWPARPTRFPRACYRITLTGTAPVRTDSATSGVFFHFLNRGLLGGRADFSGAAGIAHRSPRAGSEAWTALLLRYGSNPSYCRRLKREVAPELPPRTEVVLRCTLSDKERIPLRHRPRRHIPKSWSASRPAAACSRPSKPSCACARPAATPASSLARGRTPGQGESSSWRPLDETPARGHKALAFSQWTGLLDRVEPTQSPAGTPLRPPGRLHQ